MSKRLWRTWCVWFPRALAGQAAELMSAAGLVAMLLLASTPELSAQVVRGTVTERGSGRALAGALVSLQDARESPGSRTVVRQTVTNERGEFAITAPAPGQYRVIARRIGVRASVSAPIALSAGETIRHDVELDPFTSLPRVTVVDRSLCTTGRNGQRVAALWEEARSALNVIVVSSRDSIVQRRLIRYQRVRAPSTFTILSEEAHTFEAREGARHTMFRSKSGDSLSLIGYWIDRESGMTFYAPDADALLSAAFLRDHCFGFSEGRGERQGLVGLTFQPVRGRPVGEIRGTLWLDASSYELRLVEFEWLGLPQELRHERVGGEVHFMRLANGAWVVKRWTMLMPRPALVEFRALGGRSRQVLRSDGFAEEGGMLVIQDAVPYEKPATIVGRIVRSNGKPLSAARVRLVGTAFRTVADRSGEFRIDSVPPGIYAIVAEHMDLDVFGVRAAEQEFVLEEGATRQFAFSAPGERAIADQLCPGRDFRLATLRVTLLDERTLRPIADAPLRLRWFDVVVAWHGSVMGRETRDVDLDVTTNAAGIAMFCSVASAKTLTLGYPVDSTGLYPLHTFKLGPQENQVATVKASPP